MSRCLKSRLGGTAEGFHLNIMNRIKELISNMKLPGCLITSPQGIFYLTGVELDGFWLLIGKKDVFVLTSKMLKAQLCSLLPRRTENSSFDGGMSRYSKSRYGGTQSERRVPPEFIVLADDDLFELLIRTCKKNRINKLGIETKNITYSFGKKLHKSMELTDIGYLISLQRMIKDDLEIKHIRKSCQIASLAVKYAQKLIKPGMSEIEIYYKIEGFFAKNNVKQAFPTIVASGPNSALPHHISSNRKIRRNDTILIDLGCIYKGYCSDLTRTFYLGKINKSQKTVFSLVEQAKNLATDLLKNDVESKKIDSAAREIIEQGGYGDKFIHTTGHGVGIEIHEAPRLSSKDSTRLKSGMVVTVEPGIYLKGSFGVRLEDTLLVTQKGCEVLTDQKKG